MNHLKCVLFSLTVFVPTQALSGQVPFSSEKTNWTVAPAVLLGRRPTRPAHPSCTEGLWALIQRCWDQEPQLRPEAPEVSQIFYSAFEVETFFPRPVVSGTFTPV